MPVGIRVVDGHFDVHVEMLTPLLQFVAIQRVLGVTAAHENDHTAIATPVGQDMVDRGTQRRQAEAARGWGGRRWRAARRAAGASPPATKTTSAPCDDTTGQLVPYGPRRPIM